MSYDVDAIRAQFPAVARKVHGKQVAYLDNAATTHKPKAVLEAMSAFHQHYNSNVHRGVHTMSMEATEAYEAVRGKLLGLLGGTSTKQTIFTKGTTESLNLVAKTLGPQVLGKGDEVVIAESEHHSNIVPWQMVANEVGATVVKIPLLDNGTLDLEAYEASLTDRTKVVACGHVSNALGTIHPVKEVTKLAKERGAYVVIDGAQAIPHMPIDVQDIGCDFYAGSAHKMYGPTGIGFLWGKEEILESMPPWQGGGDMIESVSFSGTTYNELPYKFEAGTPNIAGAIGFGAAIDWVQDIGLEAIGAHEQSLLQYATKRFHEEFEHVRIIGEAPHKAAVLSFHFDMVHPHDMGSLLDQEGIAVRTGHHCAQPVMERYQVPATTRASFGCYNTLEEVDRLVEATKSILEMFA